MNINLHGRVALISGASRGIGRGHCASDGAVRAQRLWSTIARIPTRPMRSLRRFAVRDLTRSSMVQMCLTAMRWMRWSPLRLNNLGVWILWFPMRITASANLFLDLELEGARRTLEVTFWGAFHMAQAGARQMVKQGDGGAILFISSVLSNIPFPTSLPYNAAKAGINQMSATIANELTDHRIRANVITPGYIDTPGERQYATRRTNPRGCHPRCPGRRLGTPEDIANARRIFSVPMLPTILRERC